MLDHWPFAGGDVILGEVLLQRRLHSLRTVSSEVGVGTKVLEHFLIESGAIGKNDSRPESRSLFDARAHVELFAEIPTLVGPITMRKAMGATKVELIALAKAEVLRPRTRVEKVKNPWRIPDGVAPVCNLSDGAIAVEDDDTQWETLLRVCRRREIELDDLIARLQLFGRNVGQFRDVLGRLPPHSASLVISSHMCSRVSRMFDMGLGPYFITAMLMSVASVAQALRNRTIV